jgi:hypothetical protein
MESDGKEGRKLELEDRGGHGPTTGPSAIEEKILGLWSHVTQCPGSRLNKRIQIISSNQAKKSKQAYLSILFICVWVYVQK